MSSPQRAQLRRRMRRVTRLLSALAFLLMWAGVAMLAAGGAEALDPLGARADPSRAWPLRLMLLGVFVLSVVPGARVLVALSHYAATRRRLDALIALLVLLVLAASMATGF